MSSRSHFVEHRLALQVLGCPNRFKQMSCPNSRNLQALYGPEDEMSDVGGRTFLSYEMCIFGVDGSLKEQRTRLTE